MISSKLKNFNNQTYLKWIISYAFSNRSLIVLELALVRILAVILQFGILNILIKSIHSNNNDKLFEETTKNLFYQVSDSITNWTTSSNEYISNEETLMNDNLFSWIETTTESVNNYS